MTLSSPILQPTQFQDQNHLDVGQLSMNYEIWILFTKINIFVLVQKELKELVVGDDVLVTESQDEKKVRLIWNLLVSGKQKKD